MGQGAQSKALRIANMTQYGFDSTKIYEADGSVSGDLMQSVENFDKATSFWKTAGTGNLPQEIPANQNQFPDATGPALSESVTFNVPDASRENKDRRTSGADIYPGGGWQEGA